MKTIRNLREDGSPAGGAPGMGTPNATPPSPAANRTGDTPSMAMPPSMRPGHVFRRYKKFAVESDTFRKFQSGRMRYERWAKYLDMNNAEHRAIRDYAHANRGREHLIVLQDSQTGALKAIKHRAERRS